MLVGPNSGELLAHCPNRVLVGLIGQFMRRTRPLERAYLRAHGSHETMTAEHDRIAGALRSGRLGEGVDMLRRNMRSGIGPITMFDPAKTASKIGGEIRGFDAERIDGELVRRRLLEMMGRTVPGENRIKAGLPEGAILRHRPGTSGVDQGLSTAHNDVGIFTLADGRSVEKRFTFESSDRSIDVEYRVEESEKFLVESVKIEGNPVANVADNYPGCTGNLCRMPTLYLPSPQVQPPRVAIGPMIEDMQIAYACDTGPLGMPNGALDEGANEAARLYRVLDRRLADQAYLAGDHYTVADVATWPWIAACRLDISRAAAVPFPETSPRATSMVPS